MAAKPYEPDELATLFVLGLRLALDDPEAAQAIVESWTLWMAAKERCPLAQVAAAHEAASKLMAATMAKALAQVLR
ncbi:MAG TPA: hypothetical protein VFB73_04760 [Chloroflexota bacterium]|nr:hypothetical protein [Chloroflexota bacterium]